MEDKFCIERSDTCYKQAQKKNPRINISFASYQTLLSWASLSDKTISEVMNMAVEFAALNLQIKE